LETPRGLRSSWFGEIEEETFAIHAAAAEAGEGLNEADEGLSRTLAMPDGTVRTLMRRWRGMGREYRAMLDLVRWRKAVGRKETVALSDNVLLGKLTAWIIPVYWPICWRR